MHIYLFIFVFWIATFSALVSLLYLIDERLLKSKQSIGLKGLSLTRLDRWAFYLNGLGFLVLTLAIGLMLSQIFQAPFEIRHFTTLLIWVYFLVYLMIKGLLQWKGHGLALWVCGGYVLVVFNVFRCLW